VLQLRLRTIFIGPEWRLAVVLPVAPATASAAATPTAHAVAVTFAGLSVFRTRL
jgi:hypothetical protein